MKKICIAGKNDIAVDVLFYCLQHYQEHEIFCIMNRNERGENSWQKSHKWFAEKWGVPIITLEQAYEMEDMVFLSTEFDRIVRPEKFKTHELYNIHFSLLPKYKGCATSILPILFGETETGVTLHKIHLGIDTGEIIAQKKVAIDVNDSSLDLYRKLISAGTELIIEQMADLLSSKVNSVKQSANNSTYYGWNYIDYNKVTIDVRQTACQIKNQIRAFCFRPYQIISWNGEHYIDATICDEESKEKAGTILEDNKILTKISTIDYNIIMYKDVLEEVFESIVQHDMKRLVFLTESNRIVNEQDSHGWSPLTVAVYNNNIAAVKHLVSRGADLKVRNKNGTTLLMYAKNCYLNTGESLMFELLMELGGDVNTSDYYGLSLLDYCRKERIEKIGIYSMQ